MNYVFYPFFGEYGFFISKYIKFIHNFKIEKNDKKIVFCSNYDKVYFPSCNMFLYPDFGFLRKLDYNKRKGMDISIDRKTKKLYEYQIELSLKNELIKNNIKKYKLIYPENLDFSTTKFDLNEIFVFNPYDITICTRHKLDTDGLEMETRNFNHWEYIIKELNKSFSIACVGKKDTSIDSELFSFRTWEETKLFDDCVISTLKKCKLYIGTDTGITHLASFLNIPTICLCNKGKENDNGMEQDIKNSTNNYIKMVKNDKAWNNPKLFLNEIYKTIEELKL